MSFQEEFKTIALLEDSQAETRGVDAFALAIIKAERQLRKLFTFLVFQSAAFNEASVLDLRNALGTKKRIYFTEFLISFDELSPVIVEQLVGANYQKLRGILDDVIKYRNKIFHGQLTDQCLSREDLFGYVDDIRTWCQLLADGASKELGYDGFGRNSYQKALKVIRLRHTISSIDDYNAFLDRHGR